MIAAHDVEPAEHGRGRGGLADRHRLGDQALRLRRGHRAARPAPASVPVAPDCQIGWPVSSASRAASYGRGMRGRPVADEQRIDPAHHERLRQQRQPALLAQPVGGDRQQPQRGIARRRSRARRARAGARCAGPAARWRRPRRPAAARAWRPRSARPSRAPRCAAGRSPRRSGRRSRRPPGGASSAVELPHQARSARGHDQRGRALVGRRRAARSSDEVQDARGVALPGTRAVVEDLRQPLHPALVAGVERQRARLLDQRLARDRPARPRTPARPRRSSRRTRPSGSSDSSAARANAADACRPRRAAARAGPSSSRSRATDSSGPRPTRRGAGRAGRAGRATTSASAAWAAWRSSTRRRLVDGRAHERMPEAQVAAVERDERGVERGLQRGDRDRAAEQALARRQHLGERAVDVGGERQQQRARVRPGLAHAVGEGLLQPGGDRQPSGRPRRRELVDGDWQLGERQRVAGRPRAGSAGAAGRSARARCDPAGRARPRGRAP